MLKFAFLFPASALFDRCHFVFKRNRTIHYVLFTLNNGTMYIDPCTYRVMYVGKAGY